MEVSSRNNLPAIRKHNRIICGAVQFSLNDTFDEIQSFIRHAVHLRRAAQTVGVLDLSTISMALSQLGRVNFRVEKTTQTTGHQLLALVWTDIVHVCNEQAQRLLSEEVHTETQQQLSGVQHHSQSKQKKKCKKRMEIILWTTHTQSNTK